MSTQSDLECKVYVPSQVRTRLESNSSQYVTLRETAKLQRRASKPNKNVKRSNQRYKERKAFKRSAKETESAIPLNSVNSHKETKNDEAPRRSGCSKELCVHRALQFLVFLFSTAALTIVILMVFGFVGQYRCGPCRIKGEGAIRQSSFFLSDNLVSQASIWPKPAYRNFNFPVRNGSFILSGELTFAVELLSQLEIAAKPEMNSTLLSPEK